MYGGLKKYCQINKLKLNTDKTHIFFVKSNQRRRGGIGQVVQLDKDTVEESRTERVLGILVSRAVTDWAPHVSKLLADCAKKLAALKLGGKLKTLV